METLVRHPPEFIVTSLMVHDTAYARASFSRHPRMRALAVSRPVLELPHSDSGCSNWQLIRAAETLATALDQLQAREAGGKKQ